VWTRVIVIGFLAFIVFNLGAGLYYMMRDKGRSDRTLNALTWRISLSVTLFLLLILGFATGVLEPHGVGVPSANP
jgi:succinate dehydrogenase/fumarate reductase cytochrome b subunit